MKTFIFGAGASLHAGYPLASELWRAIERWGRETLPADHDFTSSFDTMNAEFDLSKSFELVLTELDNRIEPLPGERPKTNEGLREKVMLAYLRATIQRMIPIYFNSIRVGPAKAYKSFANEVLAPGDVVITFNYDVSLDRELRRSGKWSIGDGYGFAVPPFANSLCKLFKLHGSTNWSGEPFGGSMSFGQTNFPPMGLRPIIQKAEFDYLGYENGSDAQCHNGRVQIASMIMPTANKKFFLDTSAGREWEGFWDSIWSQAATALKTSDEVYLIGYSIPEYDTRARELIRSKVRSHVPIIVCCHDATTGVIKSLRNLGHTGACSAGQHTFEDWIRANATLHG